ncbi:MAG: reverse transcriptase family protein [Nitrospinales bacterium]|nr:reverse transcriptase family protein [Nitrospinales bacterium]
MIFDGLYTHIYANNLISDKQSGYKTGDSTIKQLLAITHEIHKAFDSSPPKEVRAAFLDISRAFDRVWHEGLIFKLKQNGIEGEMINILGSFLDERVQRVTIDGKSSSWANIEAGVPQGSILGPILFLVYINDLVDQVESEIRIFADDTFIFRIVDHDSTTDLNRDLEKITEWATQWKMVFNPDIQKQAIEVSFSSKRAPSNFEILDFNHVPVRQASETKHLGMTLDSKLNFSSHIADKLSKAYQGLGVMHQLSKWVPRRSLEEIYKLYVRPHLDYGDVIYDIADINKIGIFTNCCPNSNMEKIEMVQYQAAKIVTGAWQGTSRAKLYDDLGWETLGNRRTTRKLCLIYEIQKQNFPFYLSDILDTYKFNQNSRYFDRLLFRSPPCRTIKFKSSFFPSAIRDWNLLDEDIKNAVSRQAFKNKVLKLTRPAKKSYFGLLDKSKTKYVTQLRMELSPLRAHKFKYKFIDTNDPFCPVCESTEDTEHFLLHCRSFTLLRVNLIQSVSTIVDAFENLSRKKKVKLLLYGDTNLDAIKNRAILDAVGKFITKTKRLDTYGWDGRGGTHGGGMGGANV